MKLLTIAKKNIKTIQSITNVTISFPKNIFTIPAITQAIKPTKAIVPILLKSTLVNIPIRQSTKYINALIKNIDITELNSYATNTLDKLIPLITA